MSFNKNLILESIVEGFSQNPYWKSVYENAPGRAKEYFAISFVLSSGEVYKIEGGLNEGNK